MIRVDEDSPTQEQNPLVSQFCEATGYSQNEILSFSRLTKLFLTRNGGLYRLEPGNIQHIKGPSPDPSERI